jgi:thiamine biosynthesis protein ThiI
LINCIIVHYSEIGTKGKNRIFFERTLIRNIKRALRGKVKRVYKRHGRIVCDLAGKTVKQEGIIEILETLPGIANFSFAVKSGLELTEIKRRSLGILKSEDFSTFMVISRRSNKEFRNTSQEMNGILGEHIIRHMEKKVDLHKPDVKLYLEICEKEAFIYSVKHHGLGGLPVDSGGRVVCLLSGGIDSPVASFLMMKRGCSVIFIHIFNKTLANEGVLAKLDSIVSRLKSIQLSSKLYVVPFEKIQREIIMKVPSKYRMIVYRRFMFMIANEIARAEKAKGIVTGDSIGQVASQTLENLMCMHQASELPVYSPLIGMNKEEIIGIAKRIRTYEQSIIPYPDCCSFNIARNPETRGDIATIKRLETFIRGKERLIQDCLSNARVF